jgi:hypothetical protein
MLASIGIIKGVPLDPDATTKEALTRAVVDAPKMIFAKRLAGRADGRDLITRIEVRINEHEARQPR